MKTSYICTYHGKKMASFESEAFRHTSDMMHRGVKAFVECRLEAAEIYLGAVFDIALIRSQCPRNGVFRAKHLIQPAELLISILLTTDAYEPARSILASIDASYQANPDFFDEDCQSFLADQYQKVEMAEKDFFQHHKEKIVRFPVTTQRQIALS